MPLMLAAALQDHLLSATNDLERLQRLLADACDTLMVRFHGAVGHVRALSGDGAPRTDEERLALDAVMDDLGVAVTALQFQDLASQLINHTHTRLRSAADQIARDAMGDDPDGVAVVEDPPLRPNPVTQDELDAGSIELF